MAIQSTDFSINAILRNTYHSEETSEVLIEKPKYTYSAMIVMAIQDSPKKKLTLHEIYENIRKRFPYFEKCSHNWQNSVRHTLSTNQLFVKIARNYEDPGRGHYWGLNISSQNLTIGDDTGKVRFQNFMDNIDYAPMYADMYYQAQQGISMYSNYQVQHTLMTPCQVTGYPGYYTSY